MFLDNNEKQRIRQRDKGVVSMIIPNNTDAMVRRDQSVEAVMTPLGVLTRQAAVGDKDAVEVMKELKKSCRYEDTVDYD